MKSHSHGILVCFCSISLMSGGITFGAYAFEHPHDSILEEAVRAFGAKDLAGAKERLAVFESQRSKDCEPEVLDQFLALKYDVAQSEVVALGNPSPDAIRNYIAAYESVRDRFLEQTAEHRQHADFETYSEEFASYQGLVRNHVGFLQKFGAYEQALDELYRAQGVFAESQEVFARGSVAEETDSAGKTLRKEVTLREKYGLLDREQLQYDIIAAGRQYASQRPGDESKARLIRAYNEYVASFPTYAKAGLFLNYRMEMEGHIDLDALVALYQKCAFKDTPQYQGSILGLSHLLIDARRPREALLFLREIQADLLPGPRIPELHYALANAYELEGDAVNALKHYYLVNTLTNRYADVPRRIEQIIGVSSEALDRMVFEALVDESAGAAGPQIAVPSTAEKQGGQPAVNPAGAARTEPRERTTEQIRVSSHLTVLRYAAVAALLCAVGFLVLRKSKRRSEIV